MATKPIIIITKATKYISNCFMKFPRLCGFNKLTLIMFEKLEQIVINYYMAERQKVKKQSNRSRNIHKSLQATAQKEHSKKHIQKIDRTCLNNSLQPHSTHTHKSLFFSRFAVVIHSFILVYIFIQFLRFVPQSPTD